MGYIKKLKNNELVGGTDKTTIYPVTSTKAVFEEVTEGDKSSFKSQETINGEHDDRIKGLENEMPGTVKSITINGGTEHTVDESGNVDLTIYTVNPDDPDVPAMAELVEKNRDDIADIKEEIGTDTTQDTLSGRITELETLVGGSGEGSVNTRIEAAVNALDVTAATVTDSTGHVSVTLGETNGKIDSLAVSTDDIASAEELHTLDVYVHAIEGGNIRVKTSAPTNPDTGAPANTVYRVAGTTTYSDYMWNGTTMVKMAEYNVDTLESQFGYYKWETASNTISITTNNQVAGSPIGSYVLTSGGSFKIKMTNKATGACTLNMNGTGVKTLLYNGDPIDSSNTWKEGEVISVYYDGTYYQASNAQGGGNAGKKKLSGHNGYAINLGVGIGNTVGSEAADPYSTGTEIKVSEGDVILVTAQGGNNSRAWGFIDENRVLLSVADAAKFYEDEVLIAPAGVDKVVLNAVIINTPGGIIGYPNYEWYFAKAGSAGAHEMLTGAYLYGDLRTLAVGQTYKLNEAVKTTDKQLLKVSKEIGLMNLIDTVAVGDLKVYGTGANAATYKALKAVSTYNGVDTEGLYAIGNPSIATITVDASSLSIEEDTDISVTIGSATHTITVPAAESETKAADIAALIAAAFTSIPGWSLTDNSDGTLTLKCNTGGANSISVSSEVGETGLVITSSIINGGNKLSKYSNGAWQAVTLANYAADFADVGVVDNTKMWQKVDATWLTTLSNGVVAQANSPKLYDTFGYDDNGAITRKAATEELMYYESIALHNYLITGTYLITVGTTQWNSYARNDIYVIPVESNNVYRITSSNEIQYCWMSDYVTPNAGGYIQSVPGYVCTRTTSRYIDIIAPLGAKYLYVLSIYRTSGGSTSFDPSSISVLKSKLKEIQPLVESNTYDLYIEDFKLSSLPNGTDPKGVAGNNRYSWNTTSNYYGVWINVTAYAGRRIRFKVPAERYMFVSSIPSASTNPLTTLLGNGIVYSNGNDTIIPNPATENGEVWMWVYTYNKDRNPKTIYTISNISVLQKLTNSITTVSENANDALKFTLAKEVTLANLPGTKSNGLVDMTGTSYSVNNNYYGYWYDITYYSGKKIRLEKGRYDLFFSTQILTTNTAVAPYALGVGYVRGETGDVGDVEIPSPSTTDGKVYCWVLTHESTITHPSKYYSIVENVPDRIKDITENTIYSQDKILYWARYTNSKAENFGLLHFSDFHGDPDAYYELQDYISKHSNMFNDVIETGDNVLQESSQWKGKVNNKALFVLGNHDCGVGTAVRKDGIGRQACFNYYFNPYLSYWKANEEGGVQIDNENYAMYWYKDYTGIRLIGLDGMHFMGRDDITDEDQETWFEETLNDAKTKGLKVMVACHFGLDDFSGEYSRWNEQTHKWEYNFITDTSDSNTGGLVMNSSTGKAVPYHWYGNNSWTWDKNGFTMRVQQACNGYSVGTNRFGDILSNWIDGGGTFIAWIGGHVHQNLMYYPARYPNILNIIVSNAGTRVDSPGEYKRNNGDFVRIAANIYYVSGDYLTVVKIGDNIQRPSLVPMSWLTINYRTGEVASCY